MSTLTSILIFIACAALPTAYAQRSPGTADGPASAPPAFDVVSIHRSDPNIQTENLNYDPGRLSARGISLRFLIQSAYNLKDFQIEGIPANLEHQKYDIVAKMIDPSREAAWKVTDAEVMSAREHLYEKRIENILVTRFDLKYHLTNKPGRVLALRKNSEQVRLTPTSGQEDYLRMHNIQGGMQIDGKNQTMDALAAELTYVFHTVIKNETGVSGKYDFNFSWRNDEATTDTNLPDISTAMRDALGVKVDKAEGDIQTLVIDHIEPPSPN